MNETVETRHDPLADRVRALVEEAIADPPFFLVDVVIRGHQGSRIIEVFVDHDDGITIDALADLNREIGFMLDSEDVISGRYRLDVSSPGADRPMTLPRQYRKHRGRRLRLDVRDADGAQTTLRGTLREAGEEDLALEITEGQLHRVRYADIEEARVELPW